MNVLDIIIIIAIVIEALVWARAGLVRGVFSLGGFWLGLIGGAFLVPYVIGVAAGAMSQLLLAVLVVLGFGFIGEALGRIIGFRLSGFREKDRLKRIDNIFGGIFAICMTLIISWLLAAMLAGGPVQAINKQIRDSQIISGLNKNLPPAPEVLSKISALISASGFPDVFIGPEPRPVEPVNPPTSGEIARALDAAGRSTVRIEGFGCGGLKTGSGFAAASNLVITNAHVVAGVESPSAVDVAGKHPAKVVLFDPDLDIAILRVDGLAGKPLSMSQQRFARGTSATVLGYPGGQALEADAASVLQQLEARGRDIYNEGVVTRAIYALQTNISQGNSGGPVVLPDGTVIGVIFARSQTNSGTGYAVTSQEVLPLLQQAKSTSRTVSTQACTPQ